MWAGDETPYHGTHLHLARPLNVPNSVQRPHPPILIGGTGEQKTLRLVAQYGDACNLFARLGPRVLQHKLAVLRDHCDRLGRPYAAIEKTTLDTLRLSRNGAGGALTPSAAIEYFGRLAALGIDHALVNLPDPSAAEPFELLAGQVLPEVAKIQVAGR